MVKKQRNIKPWYFIISIVCILACSWYIVPGAGDTNNAKTAVNTVSEEVPTIFIRQDTCETLLRSFCENHGNVKFSSRPLGSRYEVMIYNFGANKETFYNKNDKLRSITNKGFKIETYSDTLKAQFVRKDIKGISCVELPSDVLYALMEQHPLIK